MRFRLTSWFAATALATVVSAGVQAAPLWATLPDPPALPHPDASGSVSNDGARIYYAVFHKGGAQPVVLLHGGMSSSDSWGFEAPRLAGTHEVVVIDSRGHGRSTLPATPLSYDAMASDVLAVMDELHMQRASIVGASDGAVIGLLLAIHHPDRVERLFAWGANFNPHAERKTPPDPALRVVGAAYAARMEAQYRKVSPTPDGFRGLKTALGRLYAREPNISPGDLARIRAPTVIADGEYEQFIDPEHTRQLARLIPTARLLFIPNVSHGGPQQDPSAFHRAVTALLDGP